MSLDMLIRQIRDLDRRLRTLESHEQIPIVARYTTNAGQSINSSTTPSIIDFEDQTYDPWAAVTIGAAWKFTAPVGGYYHVTAKVVFDYSTDWAVGELCNIQLWLNGEQYSILNRQQNYSSGDYATICGSDDIHLAATDYLDIRVAQVSGVALTLIASAIHNYVTIHRI